MIQQVAPTTVMHRVECPVWHSPILYAVPDGILVKCKSCRKEMHLIRREELELIWEKFKQGIGNVTEDQGQIIAQTGLVG